MEQPGEKKTILKSFSADDHFGKEHSLFKTRSEPEFKPEFKFNPILTGEESGEDLILKYNEYYRQHKYEMDAKDSNTTVADSPSKLLQSRQCRMVLMRHLLAISSLLLWGFTIAYALIWFFTFFVWPMNFSRGISNTIKKNTHFALTGRYMLLIMLTLHTYIPATWGFIGTFCGRNKVLKAYMLLVPWFLGISVFYAFLAVKFVGDISYSKIQITMDKSMGHYYQIAYDENGKKRMSQDKEAWDRTQNYLKCCGIDDKSDWVRANSKLIEIFPASCCKTTENRRQRDKAKLKICMEGKGHNDIWERGCKKVTYEFFILIGAGITAMGFTVCLLIVSSVYFAHRYYVLLKKLELGSFKYPGKEYMMDFFCIGRIVHKIKECKENRKNSKSKSSLTNSKPAAVVDLYKNPAEEISSETKI